MGDTKTYVDSFSHQTDTIIIMYVWPGFLSVFENRLDFLRDNSIFGVTS